MSATFVLLCGTTPAGRTFVAPKTIRSTVSGLLPQRHRFFLPNRRSVFESSTSSFQAATCAAASSAAGAMKENSVGLDQLEQLRSFTKVVADTSDFDSIKKFKPLDATTNPSLILQAAKRPEYGYLVDDAIKYGRENESDPQKRLLLVLDKLAVNVGLEILKIIPGRVSTEMDARLSFDTQGTVERALRTLRLYDEMGIGKERIYIKIAATWEGIQAAKVLEAQGINTNMTLLFSFPQAVACAEANAAMISPFVGRILDWYRKATGKHDFPGQEDPGVIGVTKIYNYYRKFGYDTIVMAASFRSIEEIVELAGVDYVTAHPQWLAGLQASTDPVVPRLTPESWRSYSEPLERVTLSESEFRWSMNEDPMGTEKLAEGIRLFGADTVRLEEYLMKEKGL